MMDTDKAAARVNRMWERLGRALERRAMERAEGSNGIDRDQAINFAKAAEACFWQATGDADTNDLKDLIT